MASWLAHRLAVVGVGVLMGGCLHDDLVVCGDLTCPAGFGCDAATQTCIDPNALQAPPEAVDLGTVACGEVATPRRVSLTNPSDRAIRFSARTNLAEITVTPATGEIAAGGSLELELTNIATQLATPGAAIQGSLEVYAKGGLLERPIRLTSSGAVIEFAQGTLDFGETPAGETESRTATIKNRGDLPVTITTAVEATMAPPGFSLVSPATTTVPAGGEASVEVGWTGDPSHDNLQFDGSLSVAYDGALCAPPPSEIPLSVTVSTDPLLLGQLTLDYGADGCGEAAEPMTLQMRNTTAMPMVATLALEGATTDFVFTDNSVTIPPLSTVDTSIVRAAVPVTTTPGSRVVALTVTAPGATKTVMLRHDVVAPFVVASTSSVNFGTLVEGGVKVSRPIMLTNTGTDNAVVTVVTPAFSGSGPTTIALSPSSLQIAPGASAMLALSVIPRAPGIVAQQFNVLTESGCNPPIEITATVEVIGLQVEEDPTLQAPSSAPPSAPAKALGRSTVTRSR